ncbi:unnamed protein product [Heterobilharzia americana]|nr:unnamed protein product [Heterobilharzia americana]
MITFATGASSANTNQLIGFSSTTPQMFSNVYQLGSNSIVSGQTTPFVLGSSVLTTSFQPTNNLIRPQLRLPASNILTGSPNIMIGNYPAGFTLKTAPVQTVGSVNSIPFTPTFAYQYPGNFT